jgi:hypothetical protein
MLTCSPDLLLHSISWKLLECLSSVSTVMLRVVVDIASGILYKVLCMVGFEGLFELEFTTTPESLKWNSQATTQRQKACSFIDRLFYIYTVHTNNVACERTDGRMDGRKDGRRRYCILFSRAHSSQSHATTSTRRLIHSDDSGDGHATYS